MNNTFDPILPFKFDYVGNTNACIKRKTDDCNP